MKHVNEAAAVQLPLGCVAERGFVLVDGLTHQFVVLGAGPQAWRLTSYADEATVFATHALASRQLRVCARVAGPQASGLARWRVRSLGLEGGTP